jgi:hypothetical protein
MPSLVERLRRIQRPKPAPDVPIAPAPALLLPSLLAVIQAQAEGEAARWNRLRQKSLRNSRITATAPATVPLPPAKVYRRVFRMGATDCRIGSAARGRLGYASVRLV